LQIVIGLFVLFQQQIANAQIIIQFLLTINSILKERLHLRKHKLLIIKLFTPITLLYNRIQVFGQGVQCPIGLFLIVTLLEVFNCSFILFELEVNYSNEEENVRPFEDLAAAACKQLLQCIVITFSCHGT